MFVMSLRQQVCVCMCFLLPCWDLSTINTNLVKTNSPHWGQGLMRHNVISDVLVRVRLSTMIESQCSSLCVCVCAGDGERDGEIKNFIYLSEFHGERINLAISPR